MWRAEHPPATGLVFGFAQQQLGAFSVEKANRAGRRVVFAGIVAQRSLKIILRQAQVIFRYLPKLVVSL